MILALDTSSKSTSLAIRKGNRLLATFGAELDEQRSARLWDVVAFLLDVTGLQIADVTLFAACTGPGGFTGLRVGIAAAKGFAAALNRLTVGVTSLEAMAAAAGVEGRILVINNAYKGEVYSQLFTVVDDDVPIAENEPIVTGIDDALARVTGINPLVVTGDAVSALAESIESYRQAQSPGGNWTLKEGVPFLAETVARLAGSKEPVTPEALQACYVRPPDIKIKPQGDNLIQGRSNVSVRE